MHKNNDSAIKIDKGVPLPTQRVAWTSIVDQMELGDSVLTDEKSARSLANTISDRGFSYRRHKEGNKVRVWKLKECNKL